MPQLRKWRGRLSVPEVLDCEATAPKAPRTRTSAEGVGRWWRPDRGELLIIALIVIVALPIVVNTVRVLHQGWLPSGDDATIAIRAHDTFTRHVSLLGMRSTIWRELPGKDVFHPGPALFWVMGAPVRLFGTSGQGLAIGAMTINVASVAGIAVLARRRGSTAGAAATLALLAVLVWSFGDEILHDPWNPHIILFPMTLLAFLVWSVLDHDLVALPIAVVVASFIAQCHLSTAPIVGVFALVLVGSLAFQLWNGWARGDGMPRRTRRILLISAVLGVACWGPVVVQQLTGDHPNLSAMADVAASGKLHGQGLGYATDRLVDALAWKPYWLVNTPTYLRVQRDPRTIDFIAAAIHLGALVTVVLAAVRTGRRTLAALAGTTIAMLLGALLAASQLPRNLSVLATYNHRAWWPAGMLVWLTLGWAAGTWILPRVRQPSALPRLGLALAVGVILIATVSSARRDTVRTDNGAAGFSALRDLQRPMLRALPGHGRYLVQLKGGGNAIFGAGPGLVSALVQRGYDVRLPIYDKEWGSFRRYRRGEPVDGTLLVLEGTRAGTPVPGFRLLGFYDARRHRREIAGLNTGFTAAVERLAVYLAPKAVAHVPV